jgi:WD40 repeat protein/predicted Ser/Thr protein kinase
MTSLDESRGTLISNSSREPSIESATQQPATFDQLFETESGITRLGSYVPLHKLGQGGMGVVYAAYDEKLDRKVALKLLRARGNEIARARMIREARAMARLSHPNVAQVYGIEEFGEQLFIVVEFIDGVTLKAWLAERTRTRDEILAVFRGAGEGLAAAHAAGLVHRDFKPDNVMVRRDGRVLVMDFGLVHSQVDQPHELGETEPGAEPVVDLTRTGAMLGTPAYMAPEQFLGRETDARSDQFSFCVTLWEALYGQRPFSAENMQALAQAVTSGTFTLVDRREVPAWLREVIVRGLAVTPEQRWPSMAALMTALGKDPQQRRRWMGIAAGALVVGGIGVGLVVNEVQQREVALADSQEVLVQQQAELESKELELEQQRKNIDDAGSVEKALHATLLVNERRGLEAMVLAVEAAAAYGPDYMSAPTPVLQALFDMQTVNIIGTKRIIEAGMRLRHVMFTPDDRHVIGVTHAPRAKVWNLDGEFVAELQGHVPTDISEHDANACAVRLSAQGMPIEVLSGDRLGRIWRASGDLLFSPQSGRVDVDGIWASWSESVLSINPVLFAGIRNVAVSPTGRLVVALDSEQPAYKFWNDSIVSVAIDNPHEDGQLIAGFSADGTRVALSRGIGPITVCDERGRVLGISEDVATTFAMTASRDGSTIITGEQPRKLQRRDGSGRPLASLAGHTETIMAVALTHDTSLLFSGSQDHTIRAWGPSDELHALVLGHKGSVEGLAVSSDASLLASGSADETVRLWSLHAPLALARSQLIPDQITQRSEDGSLVLTREPDRLLQEDGRLLADFDGKEEFSYHYTFAPDSSALIRYGGTELSIWDRTGHGVGEIEVNFERRSGGRFVTPEIAFSPNGQTFYVSGQMNQHCIWGYDGACRVSLPLDGILTDSAIFTDEGTRLLTYSAQEHTTYVWSDSGQSIAKIASRGYPRVSPDHTWVFTHACNEAPRIWSTSGDLLATLPGAPPPADDCDSGDALINVSFSSDARMVALLINGEIHVWDKAGASIMAIRNIGTHRAKIVFAPDGSQIAAGSDVRRIWALDGTLVATLDGHANHVDDLEYSPDGRLLGTGSSDVVHLWDPKQGRMIASLRGGSSAISFSKDGSHLFQNGRPNREWLLPAAAMQRACEILPDFPEEYRRVASICDRIRQPAP